jgi:hypothetical protein
MARFGMTLLEPHLSVEASSQSKSPGNGPMDVSDDEQDEALLKLNKDELWKLQKVNSIQCIELMKISPKEATRFDIPLCWMVYMPLVWSTLINDIKRLEAEFIHKDWPGALLFYVSICNKHGEERSVSDVDRRSWGPHKAAANSEFKAKLAANPHLKFLSDRMFFICDGNHQFMAWTNISVGCIRMIDNGNTQCTTFSSTLREACSPVPCMKSTSESIIYSF